MAAYNYYSSGGSHQHIVLLVSPTNVELTGKITSHVDRCFKRNFEETKKDLSALSDRLQHMNNRLQEEINKLSIYTRSNNDWANHQPLYAAPEEYVRPHYEQSIGMAYQRSHLEDGSGLRAGQDINGMGMHSVYKPSAMSGAEAAAAAANSAMMTAGSHSQTQFSHANSTQLSSQQRGSVLRVSIGSPSSSLAQSPFQGSSLPTGHFSSVPNAQGNSIPLSTPTGTSAHNLSSQSNMLGQTQQLPLARSKSSKKKESNAGKSNKRKKTQSVSTKKDRNGKIKRRKHAYNTDDEDTPGPVISTSLNQLWPTVSPYFAPIEEDHLRFLKPIPIKPDDDSFTIPPLGKHYLDQWSDYDDQKEGRLPRMSSQDYNHEDGDHMGMGGNDPMDDTKKETPIATGELTARVLAALVEEDLHYIDQDKDYPKDVDSEYDLGTDIPPVDDYSHHSMQSLEERIKMELRSIGLLGEEEIDLSQREDDELCAELRSLQQKLRDIITVNNQRRTDLFKQGVNKRRMQIRQRQNYAWDLTLEKMFKRIAKQAKRSRKKASKSKS